MHRKNKTPRTQPENNRPGNKKKNGEIRESSRFPIPLRFACDLSFPAHCERRVFAVSLVLPLSGLTLNYRTDIYAQANDENRLRDFHAGAIIRFFHFVKFGDSLVQLTAGLKYVRMKKIFDLRRQINKIRPQPFDLGV